MRAAVVVVGGGMAGLSCALTLLRQGIDVALMEQQAAPGGNVLTRTEDGFVMERGPHTFLASADDLFKLAEQARGAAPTRSGSKVRQEAVDLGTRQIMQALADLLPEKYQGAYSDHEIN